MAVSAIFKGARLPRMPARMRLARPPGRVAVLAWALGIVALGGAAASSYMSHGYGVSALVVTGPASASIPAHPKAEPREIALDPTEFRRTAPSADGRPRVAVIVRGLGLSRKTTAAAIADLPADVTLALSAYGRDLQRDADTARADGHEVFLDMPVEPAGYPGNDAGPQALLTSLTAAENDGRLQWALSRFIGFPGIVFAPGSPALDSAAFVTPLLHGPGRSGLVWAAFGAKGFEGADAAVAAAAIDIAAGSSDHDVDMALERLEAVARKGGSALAIVSATPVVMARVKAWAAGLEDEGIALVPASALAVTPAS